MVSGILCMPEGYSVRANTVIGSTDSSLLTYVLLESCSHGVHLS